jgi:hypothetical protein
MARPSYKPSEEHLETAYKGAKKGLNHAQIAKAIGISASSIKRNLDKFGPYIKRGREESRDIDCKKIENTLVKRCTGYFVEESTKETRTSNPAGGEEGKEGVSVVTEKITKKWVNPSDVLTMFVLCNRIPDRWQSINRPVIDPDASKGEIQSWFETMKKGYEQIKSGHNKSKKQTAK